MLATVTEPAGGATLQGAAYLGRAPINLPKTAITLFALFGSRKTAPTRVIQRTRNSLLAVISAGDRGQTRIRCVETKTTYKDSVELKREVSMMSSSSADPCLSGNEVRNGLLTE